MPEKISLEAVYFWLKNCLISGASARKEVLSPSILCSRSMWELQIKRDERLMGCLNWNKDFDKYSSSDISLLVINKRVLIDTRAFTPPFLLLLFLLNLTVFSRRDI